MLRTEKMIGAKCVNMLIRFILTNGLWRVMFRSDGDYMHPYWCIPKVHVYYWQSRWHVIFNCWFAL